MALILNMASLIVLFAFDMDDNLGHEPGKRPALGCSKELKRCVRAETGGTSEGVYFHRPEFPIPAV